MRETVGLFQIIVLISTIVPFRAFEPNCTSGILDDTGRICCTKGCGKCNDLACDTKPGGPAECCEDEISAECLTAAGPPPCMYPRDFKPRCTKGIATEAGDFCCNKRCGECGGPGCALRLGGASQCCPPSIKTECSSSAGPPPCHYPPKWFNRCLNGIESDEGGACCPEECGECGGPDCHLRPGGNSSCCTEHIRFKCFSAAGPPPCVYPPKWKPTCAGGILSEDGETCCSRECGKCGTVACDMLPG